MRTITRRLEIDAGHRLLKHAGKCRNVHGHRYAFEVTVSGDQDEVGRIVDFSELKAGCASWLDEKWDHGMILQMGDPLIAWCEENDSKHYVMVKPPTVENLLIEFRTAIEPHLYQRKVLLRHIRAYETPNCWADWEHPSFDLRGGW